MENLAGNTDCDEQIRRELTRCGIDIVEQKFPVRGEVPARLSGRMGDFTFTRAWCYWVVEGFMPLDRAWQLYETVVGRQDIRVAGHCMCPPPDKWAKYYDKDDVQLVSDPNGSQARECSDIVSRHPSLAVEFAKVRFVPDASAIAARAGVTDYHIDSELGLYLFAEMIRDIESSKRG